MVKSPVNKIYPPIPIKISYFGIFIGCFNLIKSKIMKRFFVVIAASCLFVTGCNKSQTGDNDFSIPEEEITASQRKCAAQEVLEEQMKADPSLRQRMEALEEFTSRIIANRLLPSGIIEIPVA